jgi:hypothetical protein
MRPTSTFRTSPRPSLHRVTGLLLLTLLLAGPAALAESPNPFTPDFEAQLEERFFEAGRISTRKLETMRAELQKRRAELVSIFAADYTAEGKSPKKAAKQAAKKKLVKVYDLLIGPDNRGGLLGELTSEPDPSRARRLAARIIEIDYALKIEGEIPKTLRTIDHITWAFFVPWSIEGKSRARHSDAEASNLVNPETGNFYESQDLAALIEQGFDISRLDPPLDSDFQQRRGPIAEVEVHRAFYGGGDPLHQGMETSFPEHSASLTRIRTVQTKPKFDIEVEDGDEKRKYKLKVGGEIHSEPTTGALLATLGFNTDVTRYVRNFRIDIGDADVGELRNTWRTYFENHRTHLRYRFDDYLEEGEDEDGRYLLVHEALLEAKPKELVRVGPWPFGANGNEGLREVRGLAVFSIWIGNTDLKEAENNKLVMREIEDGNVRSFHVHHDIGHSLGQIMNEQINAFPWDIAHRSFTGKIKLNYHSVWHTSLHRRVTYADARWMVRLIAQLTRHQIQQAVALGGWPAPVEKLLTEKLVHRRNQLVEVFELVGENSDSGPIELLPADRHLTTEDGAVVDGELTEGAFADYTQEFDNYWGVLLMPVWDRIALMATAIFQGSGGQVFEIILDPDRLGLPTGLVAEVLLTVSREIVENPNPANADEHFLVQDVLIVGLRLGGGFVARGETTYYRKYVLIQPAGTEREARFARGTVLDLVLPYSIARGRVPETYVLLRESYVDVRARVITDDLTTRTIPLGADLTLTYARPKRNILAVKNGSLRAFQDRSNYVQETFRIYALAVIFRLPLLRVEASQGRLTGDFYTVDLADAEADPALAEAVRALVRRGRFSGIATHSKPVHIESDFRDTTSKLGLLGLAARAASSRFDEVTVTRLADGVEQSERFAQYRAGGVGFWRFLDFGERRAHLVRAITPLDAEGRLANAPVIEARYFVSDKDSHSEELSEGYLHFINALGQSRGEGDHPQLISFSPNLHSSNQRWGHLYVRVAVGYSQRAVEQLLEFDAEEYWAELARALDIEPQMMRKYRHWMHKQGKHRRIYLARIPTRIRRTLIRSQATLALLHKASNPTLPLKKRIHCAIDALAKASYTNRYSYDPRVLTTLHQLLGDDDVSVTARITQPAWVENRLPDRIDLVGSTHVAPFRPPRKDIVFRPLSIIGLYRMLDTFPY